MCDYVIDLEHNIDCIIKLFIGSILHGFKYFISVKYCFKLFSYVINMKNLLSNLISTNAKYAVHLVLPEHHQMYKKTGFWCLSSKIVN